MLRLRGHHLLCLHGFRGRGYSLDFIENMQTIRDRLIESPELQVEVLISPDMICESCPNLSDNKCIGAGEGSEAHISAKDAFVLSSLSLEAGAVVSAGQLFAETANAFCTGLADVCSKCEWHGLGWCDDGIRNRAMCTSITRRVE